MIIFRKPLQEGECDVYGNPVDGNRLVNCCFPDCGCDGSRLCNAENGPSNSSIYLNLEAGSLVYTKKKGGGSVDSV